MQDRVALTDASKVITSWVMLQLMPGAGDFWSLRAFGNSISEKGVSSAFPDWLRAARCSFLPSSHVAGSFWLAAGVGHNWSQMPIYMQAPQPCGTWMFWLPCFFPCNDIHSSENFREWGLMVCLSPEWKLASLFLLGGTFWCLALV